MGKLDFEEITDNYYQRALLYFKTGRLKEAHYDITVAIGRDNEAIENGEKAGHNPRYYMLRGDINVVSHYSEDIHSKEARELLEPIFKRYGIDIETYHIHIDKKTLN